MKNHWLKQNSGFSIGQVVRHKSRFYGMVVHKICENGIVVCQYFKGTTLIIEDFNFKDLRKYEKSLD